MLYIHVMNLRSLDLNLLVVFEALMRERHVTRAANDIGLSQPAFSNALTRLRERLGDELFIRTPEGMRPTAWALELSGPISSALTDIQSALSGATFDPSTSKQRFTIATPDYTTITLFPRLLRKLQQQAPGIRLEAITPSMHYGEYLDTQRANIALLNWPNPPERFQLETLFQEDWVCIMRPDHPMRSKRLTLDRYSNAKHLMISSKGERRNWIDDALAEQGRSRHIAYAMPTYGPAPLILETTDFILTCPESIGREFNERNDMLVFQCPLKTPSSIKNIHMISHSRLGNHPAQSWLREILKETGAEIAGLSIDKSLF